MQEQNIIFNDQIETYGYKFITKVVEIPKGESSSIEIQKRKLLAILFEQFLLFDKIAIKIDRENLGLYFLISELGLNKVEELLDYGVIIPVLWTPMILTSKGIALEDGTFTDEGVKGQFPIIAGRLSDEDSNPENSIDKLLSYFLVDKARKRIFKKKVIKRYVLPEKAIADKSAEIVIDAYNKNRLLNLGLNGEKDLGDLNLAERHKLFILGNDVLSTSVLAEKKYKSYDNYSNFNLTKESLKYIESAYNVTENTSKILKIENVANIQDLYLENKIPFERVFDLRYKKSFKEYRKWINSISVDTDTKLISKEFIDEAMGKNKFFESTGGKFLRNIGMLGLGIGIGSTLGGIGGVVAGASFGKAADFGLSLLDTYVLDGILKGWNPRMFVDELKIESSPPARLDQNGS